MQWKVAIALAALGLVNVAHAADFTFGRPVRVAMERNVASGVAIGDANGDGRMDLAETQELPGTLGLQLSLFLQRADGKLAAPLKVKLPPNEYGGRIPVTFVDLDHQAPLEIVVGHRPVVARLAGGVLSTTAFTVDRPCTYLATGDIDGDGNMDVACHDGYRDALLFYGDGRGGFRPYVLQFPTDAWNWIEDIKSVRLADVTGDDRVDLLVTASKNDKFFVFANNGIGSFFSTVTAYAHPASPTGTWSAALEVLDLDGDGVNEIVTASPENQPDALLNVYQRGAGGMYSLAQRIPIYDSTTALLAFDIDGDGDKELLAGHYEFNEVSVIGAGATGIGTQARFELPAFGSTWEFIRPNGSSHALALGDLNGDGCVDLASATYSGVMLLYGCKPSSRTIPVSDFDGDGVSDLLWRFEPTGENFLWQWADYEAWRSCHYPCPVPMSREFKPIAVGDFDGDGNSDVFWRDHVSWANKLMLAALYERQLSPASSNWQVVGAGDFDHDDRSDLVWRNFVTGQNMIWRSAVAEAPIAMGSAALVWKAAAVGDFDGDHVSDIFWRNTVTGANVIWLSGNIATPRAALGVKLDWSVAGVGDFDADGKDDLLWRNANGVNAIWRSGNSATARAIAGVGSVWQVGAVGDYNGDGYSDIAWHNVKTEANLIWRSANSKTTQAVAPSKGFGYLIK